jgi:hypothetical protein
MYIARPLTGISDNLFVVFALSPEVWNGGPDKMVPRGVQGGNIASYSANDMRLFVFDEFLIQCLGLVFIRVFGVLAVHNRPYWRMEYTLLFSLEGH